MRQEYIPLNDGCESLALIPDKVHVDLVYLDFDLHFHAYAIYHDFDAFQNYKWSMKKMCLNDEYPLSFVLARMIKICVSCLS